MNRKLKRFLFRMDDPACRICLESNGILFSPCLCNGSIKYVHETCLETWRKKSINVLSKTHCEQCKYKYKFKSNYLRTLLIYGGLVGLVGYGTNTYYNTEYNSIILGVNILGVLGLLKLVTSPIFIFMCITLFTTESSVINYNINLVALFILATGTYNLLRFINALFSKRILSRS